MKSAIVIALLVLGTLNCEEAIDFGFSGCTFFVNYQNGTCVDFAFQRCEWTECTSSYIDRNGTFYCLQYTTFQDADWRSCTYRCCDGDVSYPQTYSSITQCQEYLNNWFKLKITIVMSIIGGAIAILLIVIFFTGRCCQCVYNCLERVRDCCICVFCCKCFRRAQIEVEVNRQFQNNSKQMQTIQFQPKWNSQNMNNSKLSNNCSVCLEDRPSLQLQCGHVFHRKCILDCLRKKHECILCRATDIDRVNVYCEQCFSAYFQGNLSQSVVYIEGRKQVCDGCHEAGFL